MAGMVTRAEVWAIAMKRRAGPASDEECVAWAQQQVAPRGRGRHPDAVEAFVNHGRWVAMCGCNSGMMVSPESDTAICLDCGESYTVTFPPAPIRERIEATLLRRPEDKHRNWTPDETVDSLEAETKDRMAREVAELRARANALAKELRT